MNLDLSKIVDIEFDGIDRRDYPDFCDAYISKAWLNTTKEYDGKSLPRPEEIFRPLTDSELDYLNEKERDFVYEKLWKYLY